MKKRFFLFVGTLSIVMCLLPCSLLGGSGRFHDGVLDVFVTLDWDANTTQLNNIRQAFRDASELVYNATEGQMRFGTIRIFENNAGVEFADYLIHQGSGRANATNARLGIFGESIDMFYPDNFDPESINAEDAAQTVAHELFHYVFSLGDEYVGASGNAECVVASAASPATACIMDNYFLPQYEEATEFCWSGNHDPDGDTRQEERHGESCWETIVRAFRTFIAPAGAPSDVIPDGYTGPNFPSVSSSPSFDVVMVLDYSGSMNDPGGLGTPTTRREDLISFGQMYIDDMGIDGDVNLGIVTYSSSSTQRYPATAGSLQTLNSNTRATNAKNSINISAGGRTNIGGAMMSGRDLLSGGSNPLILILMTDGFHNEPPFDPTFEPLTVLPSLIDEAIHIHTVALGDDTNESVLKEIAQQSGGIFIRANNSFEFAPTFATLAGITKGGTNLAPAETYRITQGVQHGSLPDDVVIRCLAVEKRKYESYPFCA